MLIERDMADRFESMRGAASLNDRLRIAAGMVADQLDGFEASIVVWDPAHKQFTASASTVPGQQIGYAAARVRQTGGASDWIRRNRRQLIVPDIAGDPFGANRMLLKSGMRGYAGVPLAADDCEAHGVLYGLTKTARTMRQSELDLLCLMSRAIVRETERDRAPARHRSKQRKRP